MPINTKPEVKIKIFKMYLIGPKNRAVINKKFDDLHEKNKMEWINGPIQYGYPLFMVWNPIYFPGKPPTPPEKKRVDIKYLNKIIETDVYFIFFQFNIIAAVFVKCFDQYKLTVINHKNNEQWNVTIMGFKNKPAYV